MGSLLIKVLQSKKIRREHSHKAQSRLFHPESLVLLDDEGIDKAQIFHFTTDLFKQTSSL